EEIIEYIKVPKWDRIFRIKDALMIGVSVRRICESTNIDRWFIYQIQKICNCEKELLKTNLEEISPALLKEAKQLGFGDEQISRIMKDGSTDEDVYLKRKEFEITRVYKMVDTCSAEFEAKTPYFYSTFE
ncbi:MAG: carbamoyl-phosphate synthase subunit L, partial [Ginsengibacter sp.]